MDDNFRASIRRYSLLCLVTMRLAKKPTSLLEYIVPSDTKSPLPFSKNVSPTYRKLEEWAILSGGRISNRPLGFAASLRAIWGLFALSLPCVFFLSPDSSANEAQIETVREGSCGRKALPIDKEVLFENGEIGVAGLKRHFRFFGCDIESIRKHGLVPRLLFSSLPSDLGSVKIGRAHV